MRTRASVLFGSALIFAFAAEPFEYHRFGIDTDLAQLPARFPLSDHEFCCVNGFQISPRDHGTEFSEQLAHGKGQYLIRIAEADSIGDLYYITADVAGGLLSRLRLSFERPAPPPGKPDNGTLSNFESRHPACAPLLALLVRRYGKVDGPTESSEERLESRTYRWKRPAEELALICGHYQGRRSVFAMELVFTRN